MLGIDAPKQGVYSYVRWIYKSELTVPEVNTMMATKLGAMLALKGIKQSDLYNEFPRASVCAWVNGKRRPNGANLLRLAQRLQCQPGEIL